MGGRGPRAAARGGRVAGTRVFDVRDFGAAGDGVTDDAPAVNQATAAANSAGGGMVRFGPGTYLAGGSIHMLSKVTLQRDAGSTQGLSGGPRDARAQRGQRQQ